MSYRSLMLSLDEGLHRLMRKPWYPLAVCIVLAALPVTRDAMLWLVVSLPVTLALVWLSSLISQLLTLIVFGIFAVVMAVGFVSNLHFL